MASNCQLKCSKYPTFYKMYDISNQIIQIKRKINLILQKNADLQNDYLQILKEKNILQANNSKKDNTINILQTKIRSLKYKLEQQTVNQVGSEAENQYFASDLVQELERMLLIIDNITD